jgi:transposase InsO family protein
MDPDIRELICRMALRDRDQKFSRSFDEVFKTEGVKVILPPVRSPKANAFAERWVKTVRAELLDWTLLLAVGISVASWTHMSATTTPTVHIAGSI